MPLSESEYQYWLRTSAPAEKCLLITLHNNTEIIYLGSRAYISKPTDSLSNQPFRDCLTDMPEISDSGDIDVGDLEFIWPERAAELRGFYWRGYSYQIRMGAVDWSYDDFRIIASGFIEQVTRSARDRLRVDFAGAGLALDQPVAETRINDVLLPVCIGSVRNVSPVQPDSESNIYYIHDGAVSSISVRVDGVAASPAIDLGSGKITFSSDPEGTVTADVVGESTTLQATIESLAARRGIDAPVFDFLDADQLSAGVGLYVTGEDYYSAVLSTIADAVGAEISHDELGILHIVCMDYSRDADYTIYDDDIVIGTLRESGEVRELSDITLSYARNYNTQSDVSGYTESYAELHGENADNHYPDGWRESLAVETALTSKEDAQIELDRLSAARFVRRISYDFDVFLRGVLLRKGHRLRIISDSWGLDVTATVQSVERLTGSNRYSVRCIA